MFLSAEASHLTAPVVFGDDLRCVAFSCSKNVGRHNRPLSNISSSSVLFERGQKMNTIDIQICLYSGFHHAKNKNNKASFRTFERYLRSKKRPLSELENRNEYDPFRATLAIHIFGFKLKGQIYTPSMLKIAFYIDLKTLFGFVELHYELSSRVCNYMSPQS